MSTAFDCDLLVVGLGPVGDVVAGLARLQNLSVIAIDREADIFPLPRAAVFDQEIMRIFQMLGISDRLEGLTRTPETYQFRTARGEILLEFPIEQGPGKWGWAGSYLLHQPGVERTLRRRLTELAVDVRLETSFLGLQQDAEGVTARVGTKAGEQSLRARYIVGCDGASSLVREAIGATLSDYAFDEPWLVIDAIIDRHDGLPQMALQICDPARPTTFMRMSGNRYRWEFMLKPGEDPATFADEENVAGLLAGWDVADRITIERRAIYRFHGLVASQWRAGRILIAGDAAHQMPPFAGQGMCSGIRDAVNLAWKLGAVIRGQAGEALLDTYQIEREPHVRTIVETAIAMGKTVCVLDEAAAAARDAAMLARKAAGAQDVTVDWPPLRGGCFGQGAPAGTLFIQPVADGSRLDDVLGPGPWLIGRDRADGSGEILSLSLQDPRLKPFADMVETWLAEQEASAVLVRPDRHVFATGEPAELVRNWRAALG